MAKKKNTNKKKGKKEQRLFVGAPVEREMRDRINAWQNIYASNFPGARLMKTETLHVTIVPPWYDEKTDDSLKKIKQVASKTKPFNIEFNKLSFGPQRGKRRLIWLEDDGNVPYLELQKKLLEVLDIRTRKKFIPHITIARFTRETYDKFKKNILPQKVMWSMPVEKIILYKSKLKKTGALYEPLEEIWLKK